MANRVEFLVCPVCRLKNPGSAVRCDCGYDFRGRSASSRASVRQAAQNIDRGGFRVSDILSAVEGGGRFVVFEYCVSIVFVTFKRTSKVYLFRCDESRLLTSAPFSLVTLLCGWWGFPWGPIFSVQALVVNAQGGRDVTELFVASCSG